ncbi:hypothetical protein PROFUN_03209 [Planoprotostelium fungivorum]|uniref:Uncharacterized protein n=1 Tax=Planoprotostelium fungivorum TaxID=1890364 RepID=A0A2P6NX03_9EUKA|nr:hypothetical protein PROFUN_03209 [Planoprotostelium fungivorum]
MFGTNERNEIDENINTKVTAATIRASALVQTTIRAAKSK